MGDPGDRCPGLALENAANFLRDRALVGGACECQHELLHLGISGEGGVSGLIRRYRLDRQVLLDGGECEKGIESSIVAVMPDEPPRLLRPGAVSRTQLEEVVGELAAAGVEKITAPGQLLSHYAPRAAVRLNATSVGDDEVLLGFGATAADAALNLSRSGDTVEAAANLYRMLRELDAFGAGTIAVSPIPETGLGEAINDRLRRAAAPRSAI